MAEPEKKIMDSKYGCDTMPQIKWTIFKNKIAARRHRFLNVILYIQIHDILSLLTYNGDVGGERVSRTKSYNTRDERLTGSPMDTKVRPYVRYVRYFFR